MISSIFSSRSGPRRTSWLLLCLLLPATSASAVPWMMAGDQYADYPGIRTRSVSDQELARTSVKSGRNRSFEELFDRASAVGRGEYLGVEPDISRNIYRFKFMRPGGNVVWVDMDGRTGKVLAERK